MISVHGVWSSLRDEYADSARKVFLFRLRLMRDPSEPSVEVKSVVSGLMSVAYVELSAFGELSGASSVSRLYSS